MHNVQQPHQEVPEYLHLKVSSCTHFIHSQASQGQDSGEDLWFSRSTENIEKEKNGSPDVVAKPLMYYSSRTFFFQETSRVFDALT